MENLEAIDDATLEFAARLVEERSAFEGMCSNAKRKRDREDDALRRRVRAEMRRELAHELRSRKARRDTDVLAILARLAELTDDFHHDIHLVDAWPLVWMGLVDIQATIRCNSNSIPPQMQYRITVTEAGRAALCIPSQ